MRKIMIADDESLVRIGLQSMLDWSKYGYEIVGVYKNGAELWEAAQRNTPDIVLTDIRMPVMDGLALIEKLGSLEKNVHVIILSSYDDFEYTRKALRLGVKDYLTKLEIEPYELLKILESLQYESADPAKEETLVRANHDDEMNHVQRPEQRKEGKGCWLAAKLKEREAGYRTEEIKALEILSKEILYRFRQTEWLMEQNQVLHGFCWSDDAEQDDGQNWVQWVMEAWENAVEEKLNLCIRIGCSDIGFRYRDEQLLREQAESRCGHYKEAWVQIALSFLEDHYHESIRLEDVASQVHLSENYFSQRFREVMGRSFSDYVTDLRVREAKKLLQEENLSTEEIAERIGYPNANYFVRVFKKTTGYTVTAYRKKFRNWIES